MAVGADNFARMQLDPEFYLLSRWGRVLAVITNPVWFTRFAASEYLKTTRKDRKTLLRVAVGAFTFGALWFVATLLPDSVFNRWGNLVGAAIGILGIGVIAIMTVDATHRKEEAARLRDIKDERAAIAVVCLDELNRRLLQIDVWLIARRIARDLEHPQDSHVNQVVSRAQLFRQSAIVAALAVRNNLRALTVLPYDPTNNQAPFQDDLTIKLVESYQRSCVAAYIELSAYLPNPDEELTRELVTVRFATTRQLQLLSEKVNKHYYNIEHSRWWQDVLFRSPMVQKLNPHAPRTATQPAEKSTPVEPPEPPDSDSPVSPV